MKTDFCLCCNKPTQFYNSVHTVKNIVHYLETITRNMEHPPKNNEYYYMMQNLSNDKQRISFPCGQCYKINTIELFNLEKKMDELICKFIFNTSEKNGIYHNLLRLFAGHYPMKYHIIETAISQKERT